MTLSAPEPVVARETGRTRGFRRSLRSRAIRARLAAALSFSILFHLSMITIFQIVIAFPRDELQYYEVRIVSSPPEGAPAPGDAVTQRAGDMLALGGASLYDLLPPVELPVLEFAELERLRIRYDASDSLPEIQGLFDTGPAPDSWARFGGELQRLGKTLREFALPGQDGPAPAREEERQRLLAHRPAEGYEAYIEWSGPPRDRELLFAPPIRALWRLHPADLTRPFEIVFKVDASGRVVNVWSPILDDSGMIDEVQMTVLQYRFAPLTAAGLDTGEASTATEQSGVLFIRAARGQP